MGTLDRDMGKHYTEDYKLSAVRYALKTDNQVETCEVFDCKRQSLQRWIKEYETTLLRQDFYQFILLLCTDSLDIPLLTK